MARAAHSEELRAAFEKHRQEAEGHVARLEQVFAAINQKPQGKTCAAIVGITDEGAEIMEDYKGSPALDAGLLAAAQAVEHYEISRYGTLRADVVITSGTLYFKPRERPAARALNNAP